MKRLTGMNRHKGVSGAPKVYPLTYEQEAIWLDDHLDDAPSRYLESWVYRLSGALDLDAVEWAIARVVDRQEVLRSSIKVQGGRLVQIVAPEHSTGLVRRACPAEDLDSALRSTVSAPMDLEDSPLRATVLQLTAAEFVLVVQLHHIVVDDWALSVLDHELGELYRARVEGRSPDLEPLPLQLGEYAVAQRSDGVDPSVRAYWRERLRGVPGGSTVPPDRPCPAQQGHGGGQIRFRIGVEVAHGIRMVARTARATPFTVLAAALAALLSGYNEPGTLVLGTPVSRRGTADLDQMIGCLTDLLPLCQTVSPEQSFAELVASTRQALFETVAHKDIPYATLIREAALARESVAARDSVGIRARARTRAGAPLCQTVLVVDDARRRPLDLPGVAAERLYVHSGTAKFDLCVTLVIDQAGYQGFLEYASDLYQPQTAAGIADRYVTLLTRATGRPQQPLAEIAGLASSPR